LVVGGAGVEPSPAPYRRPPGGEQGRAGPGGESGECGVGGIL